MKFKKANPEISEFLDNALVSFNCEKRKMFGHPVYFVNRNMFAGVFGDDIFIRLSEADRKEILSLNDEASLFEPLKGRVMKEYVVLPESLYIHRGDFAIWLDRAYGYVLSLPPKKVKKKKSK
ncbi:MAG: TfoX/Sxy family protein [Candidatus Hydrothermarchaeales archaeon]